MCTPGQKRTFGLRQGGEGGGDAREEGQEVGLQVPRQRAHQVQQRLQRQRRAQGRPLQQDAQQLLLQDRGELSEIRRQLKFTVGCPLEGMTVPAVRSCRSAACRGRCATVPVSQIAFAMRRSALTMC